MNIERLIHMPQCSTIDLSALCNSSNSIWKTIESHRWVKLSFENIGMCLSCVPFTLVIRLINSWDFIQIWYDNKMLSSQWDNDNQHFVYIIISWYLLGIITRQGFLFSCSCMNRCTCIRLNSIEQIRSTDYWLPIKHRHTTADNPFVFGSATQHHSVCTAQEQISQFEAFWSRLQCTYSTQLSLWTGFD